MDLQTSSDIKSEDKLNEMDPDNLDCPRQEVKEWIGRFQSDSMKFTQSSVFKSSTATQKFLQDAHKKFMSPPASSSDLFTHFVSENEEKFSDVLRTASNTSMAKECDDFVHCFSRDSAWTCQDTVKTQDDRSLSSVPLKNASLPQFHNSSGFTWTNPLMSWSLTGRKCFESWSTNRTQMSRSAFEYPVSVNSFRYSSEHTMHCYQETFDVSESESDDDDNTAPVSMNVLPSTRPLSIAPSELSEVSLCATLESESGHIPAIDVSPDHRKDRAYKLANELLTTERSYEQVLHLIDQVFHFRVDQENRAHPMFPQEMIPQMFSNIKSIYKFHHEFLLPQLESRMLNWEQERRIGDIMKNFAPFLKMYTEYVKNFDNAMNIINTLSAKNQRFAAVMDEIHQMPECGGLTLTHHMLSPIQRIPRYELLLKDYVKKLPDDSPDREDAEKALHLVSTAANHANDAMKKIDKFKKLLEIQENISGVVDLVSPTRELIKEGKIVKISARSGDHQERYLFLFSDILLLCSPRLISNRMILGPGYRLRAKFNVEEIQVLEGDNLETANTFYIRDSHKNVELYTQTVEEKSCWLDALCLAIQELYERKSSLKIGAESLTPVETDIGKKAPNFIKLDSVTKCMDCATNFSVMKRKHHCRACGIVLCNKCSNQKFALAFEDNKSSRVCRHCHQILSHRSTIPSPDRSPDAAELGKENIDMMYSKEKGVLEVAADASCVLNGYLHLKTNKSWVQRWFSLHNNFVLYSFRSHTELQALTATPLPGFTVDKVSQLKGETFNDKERIFKMFHTKKTYYFQANSKEDSDKWVHALQRAAQAQLPSPDETNR